jgi:hypothetical protein
MPNTKTITSDDIRFAVCDCWIWPIIRYAGVGQCGRCRTRPEGSFASRSDAFDWYYALHGIVPKRMGA